MGQKTHPYAFRLGIVTDWKSKWYSDHNYVALVNEDWKIRDYLSGELLRGAVSRIDIERTRDRLIVDIHTARPGVVIGRRGSEAERLRGGLEDLTGHPVKLNINEVKDPDLDATLLARGIADQLENRIAFRRAMKRAVTAAMKAGAEGVRVEAKGRLGGSDMGRREWYREGRVPLHTLRADIDFGTATAHTTVGTCGVKVWVYKGEVLESASSSDRIAAEADLATGGRRRRQSVKSRAEAAAEGGERQPRLIEAGGGKRLIEAGGGKKEPGGRRVIEAGGGRRPTAAEAKVEYETARDEVTVEEDGSRKSGVESSESVEGVLDEAAAADLEEVGSPAGVEVVFEESADPSVPVAETQTDEATSEFVADLGEEVASEPDDVDNVTSEAVEQLVDEAQAAAPEGDPELEVDPATLSAEDAFDDAQEAAEAAGSEAQPFAAVAEAPYGVGSAAAGDDGAGPDGWPVKGNADSMLYHTPDSPYYQRTKAEVWFQDEESAAAAGFQRWDHKKTEAVDATES